MGFSRRTVSALVAVCLAVGGAFAVGSRSAGAVPVPASSAGTDTVTMTAGRASTTATIVRTALPAPPLPAPTLPVAARPGALARPRVVAGDQALAAAWAAPASGGPRVTAYTATAMPGGASCTVPAPTTTCIIGNLDNAVAYRVTVVARSAAGVSVVSPPSPAGTPRDLVGPAARLFAERTAPSPGTTTTLTAVGFRPRSTVSFWLHSEPVPLGTAAAGADGRATVRVTLPAALRGRHTATAEGVAASGRPLSRSFALTFGRRLPSTGSDVLRLIAVGLVLIGFGVLLLVQRAVPGRWRK